MAKTDDAVDPAATDTSVAPATPVEEAASPAPEVETPAEDASEPVEETPAPEVSPEAEAQAEVLDEEAQKDVEKAAEEIKEADALRDPTPVEEAAGQVPGVSPIAPPPFGIDGQNIGLPTNDDFTSNLPKNENGQVEINSEGKIVGVNDTPQ